MARPHDVVQIEKPIVGIIVNAVHLFVLVSIRIVLSETKRLHKRRTTFFLSAYHVNLMPNGNEKVNGWSV